MATIYTRATAAERAEYHGIYPLWGWVNVGAHRCAIEHCNGKHGDPTHEIMAPDGAHFTGDGDGCHSMLCHGLKDLAMRAKLSDVEMCSASVFCGCDDGASETEVTL